MSTAKQPLFLRIFKNGKLLDVKQFTGSQIVIGREGKVDALINDTSISPIHAMIEERGEGTYYLCDLGSQGGTFVKGEKVVDYRLESGTEFNIGQLTIEFHIGVPKVRKGLGESTSVGPMPSAPAASAPVQAASAPIPKEIPKETPKEVTKKTTVSEPMKSATSLGLGSISTPGASKSKAHPPKGTFAPPSSVKLNEQTKPSKGNVVEVVLIWHDRVLHTYHFTEPGTIQIGSHPKNQILLPNFGSVRLSHPLLTIQSGTANVLLTSDMTGDVIRENETVTIDDMRKKGSIMAVGAGYQYLLQQNEAMKINIGEGLTIVVRYVSGGPDALIAPLIDFSVNQLTGFIVGLMGTALFLFYAYLYAPTLPEKQEEEEPPRKAQFFYKKPPTPVEIEDKPVAHNAPVTEKTKEPPAPSRGEEGASSEPKHTPNTTNKIAKQKGNTQHAQAAAAPKQPKPKDVSKSGLLGVFGTHGMQAELNKAAAGAGNAAGLAKSATGSASEGEGVGPGGNSLKDVGANGNGTATVGIAGVKTKGRGGGLSGYGTGGLGAKKNASLIAGDDQATFSGSIDKEAIRRVVQANLKQIKACYERGLNRDPSLYGKIVIQWTIGPGGRVLEANVKNTTMNSSEVESCAVSRLRTWKFPEPPAGEVAVVSYPFVFQAQE